MFGNNFTLFEFMGFRVRANVSWLFLALLVLWSLAAGFFPTAYPGLSATSYWSLAAVGTVGLFFSLLFHEFSHSVVARTRGVEIRGITLFLFGGVAEMEMEPPSAKTEFLIAIAGPISSVLLAALFYLLSIALAGGGIAEPAVGVVRYLAVINLLLAVFNMVPGFPLDGGRVLRAAVWQWRGDLRLATRWASRTGQVFGFALVGLGILSVLGGNFVGGTWWVLIGLFLQAAAGASYQRLLAQEVLRGLKVRRFMTADPVVAPAEITVQQFVDDYLYQHGHDLYPVVSDERLVGCATTRHVKNVPREEWARVRVGEITDRCSPENTISADADATDALSLMQKSRSGRLMVTQGERLVGVIVVKDLLRHLAVRSELES